MRKGDRVILNIYQLHHNGDEWQEPDSFIPERFDPQSKYRLTPSGKPRHPMSYIPFLGGKRVCVGKTFAETTFRFILPIILNSFEFEFVNPEQAKNKQHNNAIAFTRPQVFMRVKKPQHTAA